MSGAAHPGTRPQGSQASGLQIVVLEGEDAVNIIQQKTATAPIVEVLDRNGQPVAGAVVRFAIRGGRATFSGSRTLTVTTNLAGRAAASGLTPTGSGLFQISASATFQGQTAAVTIAQTNVMTAVQAAQIASTSAGGTSGAAGGGGAAGAGGSGGGLSATTIGVIGGAAAGGTLVATQVLGDSSDIGPPEIVSAAVGTSNLVSVDSVPLSALITPSTVNCPVFMDSGTLIFRSSGQFEVVVVESIRCILPPTKMYEAREDGRWRAQEGGRLTLSPNGSGVSMGDGMLANGVFTNSFGAQQNEPNLPLKTVAAVWQKQ